MSQLTEAQKQLKAYQSQITENDVKRDCINLLIRLGWLVLRINSGAKTETDRQTGRKRHYKFCIWHVSGYEPQSAGVSDILAVQPGTGRLWAIETKRPGKIDNLTQSQVDFQAAVREAGAVAVVVDSAERLLAAIVVRGLATRISKGVTHECPTNPLHPLW